MAEANNSSVPKKRRLTDQGLQFSLNIELPRAQESRLLGIKDRLKMVKGSLNLMKVTSSTQKTDLMEARLLAFEEKMVRRSFSTSSLQLSTSTTESLNSSRFSTPSTTQQFSIPTSFSTPQSRISLPISDPVSPISPPLAEHIPQESNHCSSSRE